MPWGPGEFSWATKHDGRSWIPVLDAVLDANPLPPDMAVPHHFSGSTIASSVLMTAGVRIRLNISVGLKNHVELPIGFSSDSDEKTCRDSSTVSSESYCFALKWVTLFVNLTREHRAGGSARRPDLRNLVSRCVEETHRRRHFGQRFRPLDSWNTVPVGRNQLGYSLTMVSNGVHSPTSLAVIYHGYIPVIAPTAHPSIEYSIVITNENHHFVLVPCLYFAAYCEWELHMIVAICCWAH